METPVAVLLRPVMHYTLLWDLPHTGVSNQRFNGTSVPLLGP